MVPVYLFYASGTGGTIDLIRSMGGTHVLINKASLKTIDMFMLKTITDGLIVLSQRHEISVIYYLKSCKKLKFELIKYIFDNNRRFKTDINNICDL